MELFPRSKLSLFAGFVLGPNPAQTSCLVLHLLAEGGPSLQQGWDYFKLRNKNTFALDYHVLKTCGNLKTMVLGSHRPALRALLPGTLG